MKTAILLLNVGTPKDKTLPAVREYLQDFLSDPFIIKGPAFFRFLLVRGLIVPFRSPKSLARYERIWTKDGSPLAVYSSALAAAVQESLGSEFLVRTGFCFGSYPIAEAVADFQMNGCREICLVPLFPQKAESTTTGILFAAQRETKGFDSVCITREFFDQDWFHQAWADVIRTSPNYRSENMLIMSYHSIPVSQLGSETPNYQDQCLATTEGVRQKLGLRQDQILTTFQSRLGFNKWVGPFTLDVLKGLREKGKTRVNIACPAFVVDGLESLEEIGLEMREDVARFGMEIDLMPCLNASPKWVSGISQWIKRSLGHEHSPSSSASKRSDSPRHL